MRGNTLRGIAALAIVDLLLVMPDNPWAFDPSVLLHLPWELFLVALLPRLMPERWWRWAQPLATALLTLVIAIKIANIAALEGFGRPFAPLADLPLLPIAIGTLAKNNALIALGVMAGAIAIVAAVAAAVHWCFTVLGQASRTPLWFPAMAAGIALAAILSPLAFGDPPYPVVNAATTVLLRDQATALADDLRDLRAFQGDLDRRQPESNPARLSGLRGKDVLVIFIESYGRSAIERAPYEAIVRAALEAAGRDLAGAGFQASSAWMTSPTFGGESWLAHGTAMSGLWVTTQARYRALVGSNHPTLVGDFKRAGWRTAAVMPEITGAWPERAFFGFDAAYTAPELGYGGPDFGYVTMPDQYVLHAFNEKEFARADRAPLMAEIALVSSHIPWAPLPRMVPWADIGSGAIFATARTPETARQVWADPARIDLFYARSLEYVLQTVTSFITTYGKDNTLVILVGDHQPMGFIAGEDAGHDVPVHIIARDAAVLRALDKGEWAAGMVPAADSPVMRMDGLRAHILAAFSPQK
ncbi:MAG: alkaline phosphatase family protein [Rhodospirillaceae bacterium]